LPEDVRPFVLPPGQYYVLGDNRRNSDDSRYNGPVKEDEIRGRAVMIFFPPGRFGRLPKPAYSE
jgi:signal peptidase I